MRAILDLKLFLPKRMYEVLKDFELFKNAPFKERQKRLGINSRQEIEFQLRELIRLGLVEKGGYGIYKVLLRYDVRKDIYDHITLKKDRHVIIKDSRVNYYKLD